MSNLDLINITAPTGGFANHVGWLIWSNKKFNSFIKSVNISKSKYESIKGDNWPKYENIDSIVDNNSLIYQEMSKFRLFDVEIKNTNKFILENIYSFERSWHNWLSIEWRYRGYLKNISVSHSTDIENNTLNIMCCISEDNAYKHYFKINSSFNNGTVSSFYKNVKEFNNNVEKYKNQKNILVLNNDLLLKEDLDIGYYKELIDFLNLSDDYNNANKIHHAWHQCIKRAEIDFLNEAQRLYSR